MSPGIKLILRDISAQQGISPTSHYEVVSGVSAGLRLFWPHVPDSWWFSSPPASPRLAGHLQSAVALRNWTGTLGRQSASGQLKLFGFEIYSGVLPNTKKGKIRMDK